MRPASNVVEPIGREKRHRPTPACADPDREIPDDSRSDSAQRTDPAATAGMTFIDRRPALCDCPFELKRPSGRFKGGLGAGRRRGAGRLQQSKGGPHGR